ncbi:MAG: CDP-glycerol glycerophosphotransferase family protein [Lachnospiraceae bacterium]|nr:CDP-glycerol glycerophosphotransferase family protein [Lachnospiraceae bacterium]
MDIIARAIEKKKHISSIEKLNHQTWEQFEQARKGKKVFLFGAGACFSYYWRKYPDAERLTGVIDNDVKKQGIKVGDLILEGFMTKEEKLIVSDIKSLENYDPGSLVILVASINYYEEIVRQLEKLRIHNIFIMLIMEANYRIKLGNDYDEKSYDLEKERAKFADSCCRLPIQQKKIVFKAFGTYSDHGKYITEQLLKLRKDIDIVWIVNNSNVEIPSGVRLVSACHWKKYIYEMETAHIWVINTIIQGYLRKREGQIYIHTKHWASITLKKFYLDASTITDISEDVELWKYNGHCMDYMITGSKFDEESCSRGFGFHKEFIKAGSPRTDAMFHRDILREKVCKKFNVSCSKKFLVYAPTYRYQSKDMSGHFAEVRNIEIDYAQLKDSLESRFGGEWYIFLRLHPAVAKESINIVKPEYVIDASDYEDSEELCSACDILISDYSSIMFEPAFVKKPVFLFATDRQEYIDKEYDLLIDYDTLPFSIAETNEELVENIMNFEQKEYEQKVDSFLNKYGVHEDGHASERAAEFISNLIEE